MEPSRFRALSSLVSVSVAIVAATSLSAQEASPPSEEADRFLRTPPAIAELKFPLRGRDGWVISDVTFGVRDRRLMVARFLSTAPDGTTGVVDESEYAEMLIEDTTQLPPGILQAAGGEIYELRAFTLGRSDDGWGFVDWAYSIGPDGKPVITTFDPRSEDQSMIPLCRVRTETVCTGLCSGQCVVAGSDPCDCNAFGFCFIDFFIYSCREVACPGKCTLATLDTCLCVIHSPEGRPSECN